MDDALNNDLNDFFRGAAHSVGGLDMKPQMLPPVSEGDQIRNPTKNSAKSGEIFFNSSTKGGPLSGSMAAINSRPLR
jgi:hypothetical protein